MWRTRCEVASVSIRPLARELYKIKSRYRIYAHLFVCEEHSFDILEYVKPVIILHFVTQRHMLLLNARVPISAQPDIAS